jgi:hypothetical protein
MKTLLQAKEDWGETVKGRGGTCPCCDRWGKIYSRNINNTMVKSLFWLNAKDTGDNWVDVPNTAPSWLLRSNQLPTLRWWGFVERATKVDKLKKFSGLWKITSKGKGFISSCDKAPKFVFTYNGEVVGFSDEQVLAWDCMDEVFDYNQVMETDYEMVEV